MAQRRGRPVAALLYVILACCAPRLALGADLMVTSTGVAIVPSKPSPGDRIRLTITFSGAIPTGAVYTAPNFPAGLTILSGPRFRTKEASEAGGAGSEYRYVLEVKRAGVYKIAPFTLRYNGKSVGTNPYSIVVRMDGDEFEPQAGWRGAPDSVYRGQAFPLTVEARGLSRLSVAEAGALSPIAGVIVEKASGYGSIMADKSAGTTTGYNVPAATWIIVSESAGTITIPSVEVVVAGQTLTASGFTINVKPTPSESRANGAVGSFVFTSSISTKKSYKNEVVTLEEKATGEGNFQLLQMPVPDLSAFDILDAQTQESVNPASLGYRGFRRVIYKLKPKSEGRTTITVPAFVWWDPVAEVAMVEEAKAYALQVIPPEKTPINLELIGLVDVMRRFDREPLLLLPWIIPLSVLWGLQLLKRKQEKKVPLTFFTFTPLLLWALLRPAPPPAPLVAADAAAREGRWERAAALYEEALPLAPWRSGAIAYNIAVCNGKLEKPGETIYWLRRALVSDPYNKTYAQTVKSLTVANGAGDASDVDLPAFMEYFGHICMALSLFAAAMALVKKSRRQARGALLGLSLALFIAAMVRFGLDMKPLSPHAVVIHRIDMRRIPEPSSSPVMVANEGRYFRVKGEYNDFYLLSDSSGAEGWIARENLALLGESMR